jgi:signal transduction histidine kinase
MTRTSNTGLLQETVRLLLGLVALAAVTVLYFWLKLPLVSAGFTYLIILVLLSLVSSFLSLAVLSLIAVGSLNYFFVAPIFSFRVDYPEDISALAAFLITSLIVTGLVRRVRAEQAEHILTSDRLRNTQSQLAHLDRVSTMGQLGASIAHEIKQPISASVTNAEAALRWLDHRPPDLEEVRQALHRIVKEGDHASEVVNRIRALIKKAPPRRDCLEINEAIREVIELTRGEAVKNGVSVKTELADGLPPCARGSGPTTTGGREPDHQRYRSNVCSQRGGARIVDKHREGRFAQRAGGCARFGTGTAAGASRASLRALLHDQIERLGAWAVYLPHDRGRARRTLLGEPEPVPWGGFSIHGACPPG